MGRRIAASAFVILSLIAFVTVSCLDVGRASVAFGLDSPGEVVLQGSGSAVDGESLCEPLVGPVDCFVFDATDGGEGHEIVFDGCGGIFDNGCDTVVSTANVGAVLPGVCMLDEACVRAGYEISGWWTEPDGGMRVLDDRGVSEMSITASEDAWEVTDAEGFSQVPGRGCLRLYAHWEPQSFTQTVRVRFQGPDGGFDSEEEVFARQARAGEEFLWERDQDDTYEKASVDYQVTADTCTTVDVMRRHYRVIYDLGGDVDEAIEYEAMVDEVVTLMEPTASDEGRAFVGWALTSDSDSGTSFGAGEDVCNLAPADESVVLVAVWADPVVISFDLDCPEDEVERPVECLRLADADCVFEVPDVPFERDLYTFVAWIAERGDATYVFRAGDTVALPEADASTWEFVAQWEPKQVCVVVPVSVALTVEPDGSFVGEGLDSVLENDSDVPVEITDVSFDAAFPWHLVGQGTVEGPNDLSLCLSLANGTALDVSDATRFKGEAISAKDSLVIDRIWGQMGVVPEGDTELGCLRFSFRPARTHRES